ncbi:hypothetical protein P8452_73583 [Trifolium repens]|nr:hypothetical protein P8452_73583 [Trifolium repens]
MDKLTGKALLKGRLKDGLYQLSTNKEPPTNKDPCITTNNTVEATNNIADQQEPELNDINTTAVESDTSEHTDENNLSNGEIEDSTEAVEGESMQEITQPLPENHTPPQQDITNTHWMRTRSKAGGSQMQIGPQA